MATTIGTTLEVAMEARSKRADPERARIRTSNRTVATIMMVAAIGAAMAVIIAIVAGVEDTRRTKKVEAAATVTHSTIPTPLVRKRKPRRGKVD
jgi:hypothetical protein